MDLPREIQPRRDGTATASTALRRPGTMVTSDTTAPRGGQGTMVTEQPPHRNGNSTATAQERSPHNGHGHGKPQRGTATEHRPRSTAQRDASRPPCVYKQQEHYYIHHQRRWRRQRQHRQTDGSSRTGHQSVSTSVSGASEQCRARPAAPGADRRAVSQRTVSTSSAPHEGAAAPGQSRSSTSRQRRPRPHPRRPATPAIGGRV